MEAEVSFEISSTIFINFGIKNARAVSYQVRTVAFSM
jgi:hypothetical protein